MAAFSCDNGASAACSCHPSRRLLLTGGAALFGLAAATTRRAAAQTAPHRIDVHHHLVPPGYVTAVSAKVPVSPPIIKWTLQKSLDDMDRAGVATAMMSLTTPGLWFGDVAFAAPLARSCNDYGATLVRDHRGRFGHFASLPMPDADASLKEIAYAFDTLHADGITLFTSYGDKWLGDGAFTPVLEELNRRKAVVFVHPTTANCCGNLISFIPDPAIEFGTDTTRTIGSLVFSGAAARFPDIRWIFSHAGGTMPFLIERFQFIARDPEMAAKTGSGLLPLLRTFYYDTAQASNPTALGALRTLVPTQQILFGTDFPFRTAEEHVEGLTKCGFTPAELAAVEHENADRLLGRA
jgi:predicted TIM-barrel fold metal-dependent hydrolase